VRKEDKKNVIRILLDNDADPNVYNKYSGFTPLHWAARYGEVEIIQMLL
jgi:ankyrin repeat protein